MSKKNSGYTKSRAPHHLPAARPKSIPALLIRRSTNDVVSRETSDWYRPDWKASTEAIDVKWILRDGTVIERTARVEYAVGEREQIIVGQFDREAKYQSERKFFELKTRRWQARQAAVAEVEREYRERFVNATA